MSRARLALLSFVAVLSATAMTASSASAISFQWFVSGHLLKAGESKEFTASADGTTTSTRP
jgi:hypothetical protein